jgi:hypothetical protein
MLSTAILCFYVHLEIGTEIDWLKFSWLADRPRSIKGKPITSAAVNNNRKFVHNRVQYQPDRGNDWRLAMSMSWKGKVDQKVKGMIAIKWPNVMIFGMPLVKERPTE